jgi:uroporphyrinogen-III decarboxylase
MTNRERLKAVLSFQETDRLPCIEWAIYWDKTIARWHGEGMPREITGDTKVAAYFGLDVDKQFWAPNMYKTCPAPAFHGSGIMALTEKSYEGLRPHLYPRESVSWMAEDITLWEAKQRTGEVFIWLTLEGFFWYPRKLMGIENHLYAFYDAPELIHAINEDVLAFNLRVLEEFCQKCVPDYITVAEDMSYNHGPMISKGLFDRFVAPYYKKLMERINEYKIPVIIDSDGDITGLVSWFGELGIHGILPLERQAGVDIAALRESHPRLLIIGGFDKTVMHLGEAAIRREFERLLPVMKQGGFIPSVDHQTPPGVSLEQYRLYVSLLKEYCGEGIRR